MKKALYGLLVLGALLALILSSPLAGAVPVASQQPQASVHPKVWQDLALDGEADVLVVLRQQAALEGTAFLPSKEDKGRYVYQTLWALSQETQHDLRASLEAKGIEYRAYYIVNALNVRATANLVHSLAARSDVDRIVPNLQIKVLPDQPTSSQRHTVPQSGSGTQGIEPNLVRVHADDVWAMGHTGQGIVVAGQDTGYDWDHPALKEQYRGWDGDQASHDYHWHDAVHSGGGACGPDSPEPCDDHGHGTHTMGTMVGDDGAGNQVGMAPDAAWIGCRNMDQGFGSPASYLECFEFFLAPYPLDGGPAQGKPERAPDVVNNSWSCPAYEGCDAATLEGAVETMRQAGIVVVVSAGNQGPSCGSLTEPPAIYQQSFSVAAFDHAGGQLAGFSSRGLVGYGGETFIKPDIAAPGVNVRSSLRGGGYGYKFGTSMAAPHIAGAIALLLSVEPAYRGQVPAIEDVLTSTAEGRTSSQGCGDDGPDDIPNNAWGWGILDSLAAVQTVSGAGWLQGTVSDVESALPIEGARIIAGRHGGAAEAETYAGADGHYLLALAPGTYDVTASAAGYGPQTVNGLQVVDDKALDLDFLLTPLWRFYLPLFFRNTVP